MERSFSVSPLHATLIMHFEGKVEVRAARHLSSINILDVYFHFAIFAFCTLNRRSGEGEGSSSPYPKCLLVTPAPLVGSRTPSRDVIYSAWYTPYEVY